METKITNKLSTYFHETHNMEHGTLKKFTYVYFVPCYMTTRSCVLLKAVI